MNNTLAIKRIAGGSVIEYPPLFSGDEEILFIIWNTVVRAYSTTTGEWIRDLDGTSENIVGIQLHPQNPGKLLVGCTVSGEIITWKYKSGVIDNTVKMKLETLSVNVKSFHIIPLHNNDNYGGLLSWRVERGSNAMIGIFDLTNGRRHDISVPIHLVSGEFKVATSKNNFYTIAVIQSCTLYVANYEKGYNRRWINESKIHLLAVACHPVEEIVATADIRGRILIYYDIYKHGLPLNVSYHWHSKAVSAVTFTTSGSSFYSGGLDQCLVRWNLNSDQKDLFPRRTGAIVHIVMSLSNQKIAFATNDNGIQIMNPQFDPISVIQNFTWVADDKTPWIKFPIGLKVNPRMNTLVLNGRIGQLQFYSTYTRSLLFNMDLTMQNVLSFEDGRALYNTRITHSALNMDWMVTSEELNDLERAPEIRLRFWKFDTVKQRYVLNTQIEYPHQDGVTALVLSSTFSVDNLLCATSGKDGQVKVWSLEESTSIDKEYKSWVCIAKTSYKNLVVKSLAFSSDGSLLSAGYGNTLCIYIPETLRIKCTLSTPCGEDGGANKLIVNIPTNVDTKSPTKKDAQRTLLVEKRNRIQQLINGFLLNNEDKLLTNLTQKAKNLSLATENGKLNELTVGELSIKEQEMIFKGILARNELNFFQKIEIFREIGLLFRFPPEMRQKFHDYEERNVSAVETKERNLINRALNLNATSKFMAQRQLFNYIQRKNDEKSLNLKAIHEDVEMGKVQTRSETKLNQIMDIDEDTENGTYSVKSASQINHVLFATRQFSHFVIVCTEKRLLIWDLLTLRLHAAIKLSVHRIVVDPYTSLIAAFTIYNELYVFLPNSPYPLYQRKNMPPIHGAAWVPRRYPKQQSLNVDWQATSQLYFLSESQELLYLASDNDDDSVVSRSTSFEEALQFNPHTPFGTMIAKHITNAAVPVSGQRTNGGSLIGDPIRSSVKSLTSLQSHTMAPVSRLCYEFLGSLVSAENKKVKKNRSKKGVQQIDDNFDDMESDGEENHEINKKIESRKTWFNQEALLKKSSESRGKSIEEENEKLKTLLNEKLRFKIQIC